MPSDADIIDLAQSTDGHRDAALDLLARFFREEGFSTSRQRIGENLDRMLADRTCWIALAAFGSELVGIVTVTTMLYIEWGRLAEIGDLYVAPEHRRRGLARRLVEAAIDWSKQRGCSGVYVTVTPVGEGRHRLSEFYRRLAFESTGRTTLSMVLER
jgi:aminoglycoside 6'-N-acetyltransferase I